MSGILGKKTLVLSNCKILKPLREGTQFTGMKIVIHLKQNNIKNAHENYAQKNITTNILKMLNKIRN